MHKNDFSHRGAAFQGCRALSRARKFSTILALSGLAGVVLFSTACTKLESRDQMNKGVEAYKGQQYAAAVKHFQQAVSLDPKSQNAQLYLATSYMVQWVPGADTPENNRNFNLAQQTFEHVLSDDPNNSLALGSLAFMAYNRATAGATAEEKQAAYESARDWNKKIIAANPSDPTPYYYLGVINYYEAHQPIQTASVDENLTDQKHDAISDKIVRQTLSDRYLNTINQGIDNLKKCVSLDPENENAMDYINLLLRDKARLEDTNDQAQADFAQADDWFNKATAMKKKKAEEAKAKAAKTTS